MASTDVLVVQFGGHYPIAGGCSAAQCLLPQPAPQLQPAARANACTSTHHATVQSTTRPLIYPATHGHLAPTASPPQGRVVPCEFIGVVKSQQSVYLQGELVSNHDELMCNFFAQVRGRVMCKRLRRWVGGRRV